MQEYYDKMTTKPPDIAAHLLQWLRLVRELELQLCDRQYLYEDMMAKGGASQRERLAPRRTAYNITRHALVGGAGERRRK